MQVKRYEAVGIQDALAKIKGDMGPDAIILSTRRLPGEKKLIEVVAATDSIGDEGISSGSHKESLRADVLSFENREMFSYFRTELEELKSLVRGVKRDSLYEDIGELKDAMHTFFDVMGLRDRTKGKEKGALSRIYYYLLSRGLSRARACKLLEEWKGSCHPQEAADYEKGLKAVEGLLIRSFVSSEEKKEGRVKVFLGPTGVGKTTTLAKLAARYALEQKLTVGLITTDIYRIAAAEQLKIYARIMDLPLEVAAEKEHFRRSIDRFSDKDVILVDTPGKSRSDAAYLSKLKDMITGDWELETNLLLGLASSRENLMDVLSRFGKFGCDRIILTKLDECARYGVLCDVNEQAKKPVSYFTTGQNVPQDIERANPEKLAELVIRQ